MKPTFKNTHLAVEELLREPPAPPAPEALQEILALLRRLDRRLAKISGAGDLAKKEAGAKVR